jgi:hypothetical protein
MARHVDLLGSLFVLWGVLQLLLAGGIGLLLVAVSGSLAAAGSSSGDDALVAVSAFYAVVGVFSAGVAALFAAPNVLVGMGLRRRQRWGWFGGLACAALALNAPPIGTALAVFAFVVLLDRKVNESFNNPPPVEA